MDAHPQAGSAAPRACAAVARPTHPMLRFCSSHNVCRATVGGFMFARTLACPPLPYAVQAAAMRALAAAARAAPGRLQRPVEGPRVLSDAGGGAGLWRQRLLAAGQVRLGAGGRKARSGGSMSDGGTGAKRDGGEATQGREAQAWSAAETAERWQRPRLSTFGTQRLEAITKAAPQYPPLARSRALQKRQRRQNRSSVRRAACGVRRRRGLERNTPTPAPARRE